jgi:hypothetical protein
MGLLDGDIAAAFGAVFGSFYPDGTLHHAVRTEDDGGSITRTWTDTAIKVQVDAVTESMRAEPGYTERDVRLIVLSHGITEPTSEDQITAGGRRWSLGNVAADPANSHWIIRGTPA